MPRDCSQFVGVAHARLAAFDHAGTGNQDQPRSPKPHRTDVELRHGHKADLNSRTLERAGAVSARRASAA